MNNFINFLENELNDYKSEKLFGIFLNGRRIRTVSGKYSWEGYNSAKKALHYMVKYYKRINWNSDYYQKYNISKEEIQEIAVDKLLSDGIIEIREVGNT